MATAAFCSFRATPTPPTRNLHRRFRRKLRHLGRGGGLYLFGLHLSPQWQRRHLRHRHELLVVSGRFRWEQLHDWKYCGGQNHLDWQFGSQNGPEPKRDLFRPAPDATPMMLNSKPGSAQVSPTTEAAASAANVRDLNEGLMQLRSTLGLAAPSVPAAPPVNCTDTNPTSEASAIAGCGNDPKWTISVHLPTHGHPHSIGMATDIASRTRYDQGPRGGRSDARVRL